MPLRFRILLEPGPDLMLEAEERGIRVFFVDPEEGAGLYPPR